MMLRVLNLQGIVGLLASFTLLGLLLTQKAETRHWRKQSNAFERLYHSEHAAFAGSVANYRAAADAARSADRAAGERARIEQNSINERTKNEFQARLADARAHAERLRRKSALASADRSGGGSPAMSSLSAPARGTAQTAGQDGLPPQDALIATELAIQLDELIKWVRAQADVDPNAVPSR